MKLLNPRIVYWSQHRAFGSAEQYIYDLASQMGSYGFEIHIVFPDIPETTPFRALASNNVSIHAIDAARYERSAPLALPYWIKFFRQLQPDLVHFNDPCIVGGPAAWLARVPHRVMMHHTPEMTRGYNLTGRLFEYLAFRSYTKVIFSNRLSVSNGIRNDGIPEEKSVVIPFGLSPDWFAPIDTSEIDQTRRGLGLRVNDIAILCPARLSRQKRHDLLIKAAQLVCNAADNAVFLLAGDGELREDIGRWISDAHLSSRVTMLGYRNDIRALITASDIVVLSSDYEGFPYVLMEAAARGTPSVSTDVGGVRHSIQDGVTGFVVPPGQPDALARVLLDLINDLHKRREFGLAARQRAEALFTRTKLVENTAHFYRSLLTRVDSHQPGEAV